MRMNVQPIPTISPRVNEIREKTAKIVNDDILPNENDLWAWRNGTRRAGAGGACSAPA